MYDYETADLIVFVLISVVFMRFSQLPTGKTAIKSVFSYLRTCLHKI